MTTLPTNQTSASGNYTTGVTLTSSGNSPFTFSGHSTNGAAGSAGLYLDGSGINWSITNTGQAAGSGNGVLLAAGAAGFRLVNSALIQSTTPSTSSNGLQSFSGGSITNTASGVIASNGNGVSILGGAGSVFNAGIIAGNSGGSSGVVLASGGTVAVVNGGKVVGGGYGILIRGGAGVVYGGGTISGYAGTAVSLPTGYANRFQVGAGLALNGIVNGGGSASTLELTSLSAQGTIGGIGSAFVNFGTIQIDALAEWSLQGPVASGIVVARAAGSVGGLALLNPTQFQGTIGGFGLGDVLALSGVKATSTVATISSAGLLVVNQAGGPPITLKIDPSTLLTPTLANTGAGSLQYQYNPGGFAAETIKTFSGPNATGTLVSQIINKTDGANNEFTLSVNGSSTSIVFGNASGPSNLYVYNPISAVKQTITTFSGQSTTGARISDIVDNNSGTCLIYAYNPKAGASQTTQLWSATAADGSAAGNEISDVIDNTDGTSAIYEYNPSSTVKLNVTKFTATNPANGAPAGSPVSDIIDNNDGTSVLYNYTVAGSIKQTATFYSAANADGSPTGFVTREVTDYTAGYSSATVFNGDGTSATTYYSGPDGTGSIIPKPASSPATTLAASPATTLSAASSDAVQLTVSASGHAVSASGSQSIRFIAGASHDTVTLAPGTSVSVAGFSGSAGDKLDVSALLKQAHVSLASDLSLAGYVTAVPAAGGVRVLFDATGHGGGVQAAFLAGGDSALAHVLPSSSLVG